FSLPLPCGLGICLGSCFSLGRFGARRPHLVVWPPFTRLNRFPTAWGNWGLDGVTPGDTSCYREGACFTRLQETHWLSRDHRSNRVRSPAAHPSGKAVLRGLPAEHLSG